MRIFIELTRRYDESKVLINVDRVDLIEPMPEKNGYGREQTGSRVYFRYTGRGDEEVTTVKETYDEIKKIIEEVEHG